MTDKQFERAVYLLKQGWLLEDLKRATADEVLKLELELMSKGKR